MTNITVIPAVLLIAASAHSEVLMEATRSQPLADAVAWLEKEAHRIIRASRREMKDGTAAFPPQVGIGYEAFWLRDYEYTLEGSIGSYTDKELTDACRLFVRSMDAEGAGVDCVKFDGTPIYRPGYGTMGEHPVADGSPFTVGVAFRTVLDMVNHFKKHGACEWINGEKRQLPDYLASAALPLDGIKAMLARRSAAR